MKKFLAVVAIIVIAVALCLLLKSKNPSTVNPLMQSGAVSASDSNSMIGQSGPRTAPVTWTSAPSVNPIDTTASTEPASRADSPNPTPGSITDTNEPPNLPPSIVLDKARVVMHNYRAAFAQNPVGTNPEITAALMGKNPKTINFLADSDLRVNEKGEMLDGYGTPVFFHQISGQEMEIRSAGEDRVLWTPDDLVTK